MSSLNRRIDERNARLARIVAALEADPRVEAAWLFGSLATGSGDAWSDLDIWISVRDDGFPQFVDERASLAARIDPPLFSTEAPQNAPAGGGYYQTVYDDPTGPHIVDWYMQPSSLAGLPAEGVLLVRPRNGPAETLLDYRMPPVAPEDDARNVRSVFWMMVLVQAKYIARKPTEKGLGFLGFIDDLLDRSRGYLNASVPPRAPFESAMPSERIGALRDRVVAMATLIPSEKVVPPRVAAFLDTVERAVVSDD